MKISELSPLAQLQKAAQIPVAIAGENRSITLGQILSALQNTIVPFSGEIDPSSLQVTYATGDTAGSAFLPVVWDPVPAKFYAAKYIGTPLITGIQKVTLYSNFATYDNFYDGEGNVRQNVLYVTPVGRLYVFDGGALLSAGLTDEQEELLKKLTPQAVASESDLEAMKAAGEIVPGQIYYIAETE